MPRTRKKLPRIMVHGVGRVQVSRLPKRIPKTIKLGRVVVPVDKQAFLVTWALAHQTKADAQKRELQFMKEIHGAKLKR